MISSSLNGGAVATLGFGFATSFGVLFSFSFFFLFKTLNNVAPATPTVPKARAINLPKFELGFSFGFSETSGVAISDSIGEGVGAGDGGWFKVLFGVCMSPALSTSFICASF